ncbi:ABC transporter permease [bacterium]|nr:MAG: ABC transporter permease [bacterium]RIK62124.1 MAG: ABC transporter permease [Planctomycetota bacterium]
MLILTESLTAVGSVINAQLSALGRTVRFGGSAALYAARGVINRRIYPRHDLVVQIDYTGARSTPIMILTGFLVGMTLVAQTTPTLGRYGPQELVAGVVGVSVLRTLGPVLAAIIFAGRVGAGFTAELGTMKVGEEVQALETMGIDPIGYLVAPRFFAAVIMLPCLTICFDAAALIGGFIIGVYNFNIPPEDYLDVTKQFVYISNFTFGVFKSAVFAVIITVVCCYKGFTVQGSAMEVGRATMQAIVVCLVSIIFTDFVLALFYNILARYDIVQ